MGPDAKLARLDIFDQRARDWPVADDPPSPPRRSRRRRWLLAAGVLALVLGLSPLACTHAEPHPAAEAGAEVEHAPPAIHVEPDAHAQAFSGPPVRLRCPSTHEHGCTVIFRVAPGAGEAQPFTIESGLINDMLLTESELLLASQISFSTVVAYTLQPRELQARRQAMRLLDASGSRIRHIARAGPQIVATREDGVVASPIDGSPRSASWPTTAAYGLDAGELDVVWCEDMGAQQGGRILRAPIDGGPAQLLAEHEASPQDVAIDDDGVYWINWGGGYYDPPGAVRALVEGGVPQTLASGQKAPRVLTTDARAVYFVLDGPEGRTLRAVPKRGGEVVELVPRTGREGHRGNHDAVQVLGEHVYFNAGDAVWQVGVDGREPKVIAEVEDAQADIVTFVVDEQALYVAARVYDPHTHERYE